MKRLFEMQKFFHEKIYGEIEQLSSVEKEVITKTLLLALHQKTSALAETIHYKDHHDWNSEPDVNNLTYESVDVLRYAIAIMNTWGIQPERCLEAYKEKDAYLALDNRLNQKKWEGQPVVVVDMDDVIVNFRSNFAIWLKKKFDVDADVNSKEYYFIDALTKTGLNPESVFIDFLNQGEFKRLTIVDGMWRALLTLQEKGYWVHILTARPEENLRCKYDTYTWINQQLLPIDRISFSSEKFRWCANSKYYDASAIVCAIDDSPKHAREYAKHGLTCLAPMKSYNEHLANEPGIFHYTNTEEMLALIENLKANKV
tara:strand:- start:473 stop:1414 length:942 start_codon:yes stop_codon:yes gene_type:complete